MSAALPFSGVPGLQLLLWCPFEDFTCCLLLPSRIGSTQKIQVLGSFFILFYQNCIQGKPLRAWGWASWVWFSVDLGSNWIWLMWNQTFAVILRLINLGMNAQTATLSEALRMTGNINSQEFYVEIRISQNYSLLGRIFKRARFPKLFYTYLRWYLCYDYKSHRFVC